MNNIFNPQFHLYGRGHIIVQPECALVSFIGYRPVWHLLHGATAGGEGDTYVEAAMFWEGAGARWATQTGSISTIASQVNFSFSLPHPPLKTPAKFWSKKSMQVAMLGSGCHNKPTFLLGTDSASPPPRPSPPSAC